MATTTALLTFEEFERLPEDEGNPGKTELLEGELIQLPPAVYRHMSLSFDLAFLLRLFLEQAVPPTLTRVLHESGYKMGSQNWLVPDVSVTHPHQTITEGKYLEGAPLIAIEVISESNRADQMYAKVKLYFEHGAKEVWVIYPKTQSVVIHHPGTAAESGPILQSQYLPGFSLELAKLFA